MTAEQTNKGRTQHEIVKIRSILVSQKQRNGLSREISATFGMNIKSARMINVIRDRGYRS
jgi:hypothetical protein